MSIDTPARHETLIRSLMDPARWPDGGGERERIDTHISSVVLAGEFAYKIKKPVDFGFLNFVPMDLRKQACEEELRLNRRLAPQIYLAVVPITGSAEAPHIDGQGEPIDWAVKMRRFDPHALLSNPALDLSNALMQSLAKRLAQFHQHAERADHDSSYGTVAQAEAAMQENFHQLRELGEQHPSLETLHAWTEQQLDALRPLMAQRRAQGHVRECHGDLHLGNIALVDAQPLVFDAIEFNPAFRWIDTLSDLAFLSMDLHQRGRADLAWQLLDAYLQHTGDYAALPLLRLYQVYRALVRAKVAAIRRSQAEVGVEEKHQLQTEVDSYLDLAMQLAQEKHQGIIITHGLSGSGKSRATRELPGQLPAIRLRSDIERKRLLDIAPQASATELGGYSAQITEATYARLAELAQQLNQHGYRVIVDATFLRQAHRQRFADLAASLAVPFAIIDCSAPPEVLQARIAHRARKQDNVSDADSEVLQLQLAHAEPLNKAELARSVHKPVDGNIDLQALQDLLQAPA